MSSCLADPMNYAVIPQLSSLTDKFE